MIKEGFKFAIGFMLAIAALYIATLFFIAVAYADEHIFNWQAPTEYVDGSPLTVEEILEFKLYCDYGKSFDGHDYDRSYKKSFPGDATSGVADFPKGYNKPCSMTAVAVGTEQSLENHPWTNTTGCRVVEEQIVCESVQSNQVMVTIPFGTDAPPMAPIMMTE